MSATWSSAMTADKIGVDDALAAGQSLSDVEARLSDTPPEVHADSDASPYRETRGGMVFRRATKNGFVNVPLANFVACIASDVVLDDGIQTSRSLEIEATLNGKTYRQRMSTAVFRSMDWPIDVMGSEAIVEPGFAIKDRTRAAIQHRSGGDTVHRRVFSHTGWHVVDGANIYLNAGGAIGELGVVEGIAVELPPELARFDLPMPPIGEDRCHAVRASLTFLDIAPDRVTVPILALAYRVPLGEMDFSVHLVGPTGAYKTELGALAQQHYGCGFTSRNCPASWSDTGNAVEELAFTSKDALLLVDDFAPNGSTADVQALQRKAERIFRAQGNRSGRARMKRDMSLRASRPPRGGILSTGEDVPSGGSLRARIVINQVDRGDVDIVRLSQAQDLGRRGVYAQAMAAYLTWLARKMPMMPRVLREMLTSFREYSLH